MSDAALLNPANSSLPPGAQLRTERERQGKRIDEIAVSLRLRPYQIEAIEADAYDRLPQGTFLRGFFKNYAKVLNIDAEPLLSKLPTGGILLSEVSARIEPPSQEISFDPFAERFKSPAFKALVGFTAAFAVLLGGFYWWYNMKGGRDARARSEVVMPQAASDAVVNTAANTAANTSANPVSNAAPVSVPVVPPISPLATVPSGAPAVAALATPGAAATPGAIAVPPLATASPLATVGTSGNLRFTFAKDAWVEVRSKGKTVHSKLSKAGTELVLDAPPPVSLIIGNAQSVTLSYQGGVVDLVKYTDVSVARLKLD